MLDRLFESPNRRHALRLDQCPQLIGTIAAEDKPTLVALGVIPDDNFDIEGIEARLAPTHSRRETMAASRGVWLLELAQAIHPQASEVVRMDLHHLGLFDVGLPFA